MRLTDQKKKKSQFKNGINQIEKKAKSLAGNKKRFGLGLQDQNYLKIYTTQLKTKPAAFSD